MGSPPPGKAPRPKSPRTERRDRNEREAERVAVLELARELAWLAQEHPRFAPQLNKLMMNVRLQARPAHIKRERILDAVIGSPLCIEELTDETGLDRASLLPQLEQLEQDGLVEVVDSQGRRPAERQRERIADGTGSGGLWTRYYRRRGQSTRHQSTTSRDNASVGSSQTRARYR